MLDAKHSASNASPAEDLNRLLTALEAATFDTNLLALNMAIGCARVGAASTAQLADAVGELSIRANDFSYEVRSRMLGHGAVLDARSLSELRRVTRGVAELLDEVSGLAGDVLDGIADPVIEKRLPEVAPDLLDQVRIRACALDRLLHAVPELGRSRERRPAGLSSPQPKIR
jgi:hypothetical protein